MNETQNSRTAAIKTLAIIGFFVLIALLIWFLIQGLRMVPGAFSSLANIAESIQNYRPTKELTLATEKSVVVAGESFRISWTDLEKKGTYEFTYTCTDGITLQVRGVENELITIPCTEKLSLPEDVNGLFVTVTSATQRFVDVPFMVTFKDATDETARESHAKVTVVNATIPLAVNTGTGTATSTDAEPETPVVVVKPVVMPKPTTSGTGSQGAAAVTAKPTVQQTFVSYYPVSDPNGFVDLKVSYLGVGEMNGNTFIPKSSFDRSERNGLKFEVKNIGTKTSGTWTFKTTLPSGQEYESSPQVALKPNERVEFTLGFNFDAGDDDSKVTVKSTVYTKEDSKESNNSFSWVVNTVR